VVGALARTASVGSDSTAAGKLQAVVAHHPQGGAIDRLGARVGHLDRHRDRLAAHTGHRRLGDAHGQVDVVGDGDLRGGDEGRDALGRDRNGEPAAAADLGAVFGLHDEVRQQCAAVPQGAPVTGDAGARGGAVLRRRHFAVLVKVRHPRGRETGDLGGVDDELCLVEAERARHGWSQREVVPLAGLQPATVVYREGEPRRFGVRGGGRDGGCGDHGRGEQAPAGATIDGHMGTPVSTATGEL
jgi:hypothetical protein